jgi:hypothetical protein
LESLQYSFWPQFTPQNATNSKNGRKEYSGFYLNHQTARSTRIEYRNYGQTDVPRAITLREADWMICLQGGFGEDRIGELSLSVLLVKEHFRSMVIRTQKSKVSQRYSVRPDLPTRPFILRASSPPLCSPPKLYYPLPGPPCLRQLYLGAALAPSGPIVWRRTDIEPHSRSVPPLYPSSSSFSLSPSGYFLAYQHVDITLITTIDTSSIRHISSHHIS